VVAFLGLQGSDGTNIDSDGCDRLRQPEYGPISYSIQPMSHAHQISKGLRHLLLLRLSHRAFRSYRSPIAVLLMPGCGQTSSAADAHEKQ
jgi:hypothetical protein